MGAWIEISKINTTLALNCVAPVWERGLKSKLFSYLQAITCRSRLGAWIEMDHRSVPGSAIPVAPVWERGLKYYGELEVGGWKKVAPVWERGLKYSLSSPVIKAAKSRSRLGAWIEIILA